MEIIRIGDSILEIEEAFFGLEEVIDEIIVCSKLLEYDVITSVTSFSEPRLILNGNCMVLIEFGIRSWKSKVLIDINAAIQTNMSNIMRIKKNEIFIPEENEIFAYNLKEFKDWWEQIKFLL